MGEVGQEAEVASVDLTVCVPSESRYFLDHGERVLSPRIVDWGDVQPNESDFSGLYLMKDNSDQHYFGWSKNKTLWWEKITYSDLLDLGVEVDDVKQIVPHRVYRLPLVGKALSTGDSFA